MMKRNALNPLGFEVPILRADTITSSSRTYPTKTITNGSETLLLDTPPHETVTVGSPNTPGGPVVVDISGADPSRCLIYHIYPDKSNILQLQDLIVGIVHGNNPRNNKTSPSSPVNLSFPAPILPHCVSCMRLRDNGWQDKYCFKFVLITADGFLHMITLIQGQDILQQLKNSNNEQDVVLSVDLRPFFQKSGAQPTCLTQAGTFICIGTEHGTLLTVPMKRDKFKNASASSVVELDCGGGIGCGLGAMFGGLLSRASHAVSSSITIPTGGSSNSGGRSMTKGIRHVLELQLATSEDLFFVCAIDESSHMYLWQLDNKTMVYDAALLPEEEAKLYRPAFARLAAEPLDATTTLLLLCFEPRRYGTTGVNIIINNSGDTVARAQVSQFQARSYELILEDRGPNVYKAQIQSGTQLVAPSVHRALDVMLEHVSSQCVGVWLLHYDSLGARKLTCIPMVFGDAEAIPTDTRLLGDQIRDALPVSREQMNVVQEVWSAMKPALDKASSMIDSSLSVVGEAVMDVMLGPGRVCRGALATALYMTLEKDRVVVTDGGAGISLDMDADERRRNEYRQSCASADVVQLRRVIRKKVTAYCQTNNINEVDSIECWCELAQNYAGAWSDGSNAPVALIQHPPASSSANILQAGSAQTTFLHAFYVARANGAVSFIRQAQATELPGVNQGMVLLKIPVEWVDKQQTRISQLFLPILEAMNLVSEAAGGALLMRMLWMCAQRGCNIGNVVLPAAVKALIAGNTAAATSGGADRDARSSGRDACLGAWRGRCRLLPLKLGELMVEIDSANNNGNLAKAVQIALDVITFELRVPSKRQPACHPTTLTAAAAIETMACQITECQLQVVTQLLLLSKYVLWSGHLGTRNHTTTVNNSGGGQQQQQLWMLSNEVRKEMAYVMVPKTTNVFIAVASAQWACVRPLDSTAMASLSLKQRINFNSTITGGGGGGGGMMNAAGAALGRIDPSKLVVHSSTSELHDGSEDAAIKRARLGGGGGGGGLSSSSTATVIQQDLYALSLLFFGPSPPSSLQQQQQGEGQQQLPPSAREYHVDNDGCLLLHSIRNLSDIESAATVFTQRLVGMTRALSLDLRSEEQPLSYSQPVSLAALPLAGQLLQHQVAPSLYSLITSSPPSNHPTGPASDLSIYDADADGGVSGLSRLVALGKDSMMTEDLHLLFFDACVELYRAIQKGRSSGGGSSGVAAGGKKKEKKDIGKSTADLLDNSMAKFFHVANIYGSADQKDIAFLVRMLQKLANTAIGTTSSGASIGGGGGTVSLPSTPRNAGELLQQTVLFYYETLTRVYRHIGAPRHAIKCAFAALQSAKTIIADPNNCKHYCSQLWRAVFSASLDCHDYEQAYVAMQAVTVPELKVDCLQRLVNILCSAPTTKTKVVMLIDEDGGKEQDNNNNNNSSRLELLVRLPYAESILVNREGRQMWVPLIEEVTHMSWRRAETLDVKAHPQPCKVLFAFFTARGDHQSAARAMFTYARRLMAELGTNTTAATGGIFATAPIGSKKRGGTTSNNANKAAAIAAAYLDTLRAVHAALTVAAASLSLVNPSQAWLEDPYFNFPTTINHTIMSGSTTMVMMDGVVVTVEDLNKEVAVAKARCTVADTLSEREQQQGTAAAVVSMISSLDTPEDIFQHLLSLNLHDEAVSLAVAVFEGTRQVRACERSVSSLATHCVRLQQQQQQAASITSDEYGEKDNGDGGDNDTMMAIEYSDGRMRTVSPPPTSYLSASSSLHVGRNRGGASSPSFIPSAIPPPPPQYHHHRKSFDTDRKTTIAAKVVVTPAQARRAWQLLRQHIERLESLSSSFIRLRLIAIESILATEPSFGIFQWLLAPFLSRGTTSTTGTGTSTGTGTTPTKAMMMADVAGLVRILMRFGRLEEAADIVIRHLEDVLVRSVPSITMKHTAAVYYPQNLLQQLMRELEEEERRGGGDGGASESQRYAAERLRKLVEEEREAAMRQTDVISRVYG